MKSGQSPHIVRVMEEIQKVFLGKQDVVRMCLVALLARGHILLEDIPGAGKTVLARALARSIGGSFGRIQFTSDLLPSDILGVTVYSQRKDTFEFHPGPVFANVVLADELNRASPRTQSALLEAMGEGRVSIDQVTRRLPSPFLLVATQNPHEHYGTYPLPESQLDRFMVRLSIGYPQPEVEKAVLEAHGFEDKVEALVQQVVGPDDVLEAQDEVEKIHVSGPVMDYCLELVGRTREHSELRYGISTRGAVHLLGAARALAFLEGRDYCLPDDIKAVFLAVCAHRVATANHPTDGTSSADLTAAILSDILSQTPIPGD